MAEAVTMVTGAAGLIGNMVRVRLEEAGVTVLPIDRVGQTEEGRPIVVADVTDVHRLYAVTEGVPLDGVIHCGAFSGAMVGGDNPNAIVRVNIGGTANILELARVKAARRVVFCSSCSAYGRTPPGPLTEATPLEATTVYGASKVAGEALVAAYGRQHGVDGTSLRLSWVYGPRRTTDCVIREMICDALAGRPTRMEFGADFHRQFIHVEDAADALIAAYRCTRLPQFAYNVTGGSYRTLGEIAGIVRKVLPGADITLADGPDPLDDFQGEFEIGAAQRDFGYAPRHDLESGIARYADWLNSSQAR